MRPRGRWRTMMPSDDPGPPRWRIAGPPEQGWDASGSRRPPRCQRRRARAPPRPCPRADHLWIGRAVVGASSGRPPPRWAASVLAISRNPRAPRRRWMLALATACLLLLAPAGAAAGERGEREDAPTYIVLYGSAAEVD